ncbi:MAG: PQQ-dependent sugar dehydrogenase [Actinomycetes bacterium]
MRRTAGAVLAASALLAGCVGCSSSDGSSGSDGSAGQTASAPASTPPASPGSSPAAPTSPAAAGSRVLTPSDGTVIATGLEVPWGLAFLPDGSALVSERDSALVKHVTPGGSVRTVGKVTGVDGSGEGGLLGLALSPSYAKDRLLYAYFTRGAENVIARMTYDGTSLGGQQVIFGGIPAGPIHNGGRIAFGPDGLLYVGTGEAGRRDPAQDKGDLGGKILRLTPDGKPAPGNPFGSAVYSLGHRNVQGLAWDVRGQLWASEFGQNTWDELNRIVKGGNYGWPVVEGRAGQRRFIDPVRQWRTDEASPSGIAIAGNAVYMAALRGARLWQIPIPGGRAGAPKAYLSGQYGRLRTVGVAPDGSLWVMTSNRDGRGSPRQGDDRIIRLTLS